MGFISRAMEQAIEYRFHPSSYNPALYGNWGGAYTSASGKYVNESAAMTQSAVWACMRLISGTIAALPTITYERLKPRGKRRATEYFLYPLLHDQFNAEQTSLEAMEMLSNHLVLRGNGYAALERDGFGWITRIMPLHPDHIRPYRTTSGVLVYDWRPADGQKPRTFRQDQHDIMHLRSFIGRDGITGMSVLEMARESFGMSIALEEYGASLFAHGAQFSGMLQYPGSLKPETLEGLKKDFAEKYSGSGNAFKPIILENGMDWVSIGMKSADAEFLASRKFQVSDVARWFQVPAHMIGEMEKSTAWGTGLEQQVQGFLNFTMGYWFKLWEQVIRRDLIPEKDHDKYFTEFLVEGLLRGDSAARGAFFTQMILNGTYSQNDVLDKENMNPFDGGDRHWMPLNLAPIPEESASAPNAILVAE